MRAFFAKRLRRSSLDAFRSNSSTLGVHAFSELLDAYWERCVKPAALRSAATVRSQIGVLKTHLGTLSVSSIEEPDEINL